MLWLAGMLAAELFVEVFVLLAKGPQASSSTLMRSLALEDDEGAGLTSAGLIENKSTSCVSSRLATGGLAIGVCFGDVWLEPAAGLFPCCLSEGRPLASAAI